MNRWGWFDPVINWNSKTRKDKTVWEVYDGGEWERGKLLKRFDSAPKAEAFIQKKKEQHRYIWLVEVQTKVTERLSCITSIN